MKSLLVRLYPARWRARYGEEFAAILEERPLGPFDVADILLGALDAQLRLRGRDATIKQGRMFTMSLRLGGAAAILGGVLFPAGFVAASIDGSDDPFPGIAFILVGLVAFLVALIGLSAFQARRHPRLIWTAFALPAFGTAVACIGIVSAPFFGDRPVVAGLDPWSISMIGLMATAVGTILFALATYRTRALSRPAAGFLAAAAGYLVTGVVVALSGLFGEVDGVAGTLAAALGIAGLFAFSIGWIALGWTAIRADRPAPALA
jgi:drug/metabolite transporter (DMT)-like permease